MAVSGKSARRLLPFLLTTDTPSINSWGNLLTAALDNDVEGGQGILSARPASSIRGRVYMVQGDPTAANNGVLWWDTGTTWIRAGVEKTVEHLATAGQFKVQAGSVAKTAAELGTGVSTVQITLPTGWTTSHIAFFASLLPATDPSKPYIHAAAPNGLTKGQVVPDLAGTSQNATIYWMSVGY